ncbi:MAG: DinB family protein [Candidatus Hodarchaeales archaeon]|jgi:uncharacterized damage-inducible protein DinB
MWIYLWNAQNRHRDSIFQILQEAPLEILRKRSSEKGWGIEEIIRHIIHAEEWWMRRVVWDDPDTPFHPAVVGNDTQAKVWLSLKEIRMAWNEVEKLVYDLIAETTDFEKVYSRPQFDNLEFSIRGVLYHLLQHELEHWGVIAERLRTFGQPYWQF